MHRKLRYLFAAVAVITAACSDNQLSPDRVTTPGLGPSYSLIPPPTTCPTVAEAQKTVDTLLPQLFGPGGGRRGKAQGYSNNIEQARRNGDTALELTYVDSLVNFTLQTFYAGNLIGDEQNEATRNRVLSFIYSLYCASGIDQSEPIPDLRGIFDADNTVLIRNGTPTIVVSAEQAAVKVDEGDVPATIFGTFVSVVPTGGLPTRLDWYGLGGYKTDAFEFVANPPVTFADPVLTGVCIIYDDAVVTDPNDLRLAHQVPDNYVVPATLPGNFVLTSGTDSTIEIAAPVPAASLDSLGLDCPGLQASRGVVGRLLQQFAKLVLPGELHAAAAAAVAGGSAGGQVSKFSPFAAVDIRLNATSTGPSSPLYIPVGISTTSAPVSVTVTTRNGATPVEGLAVNLIPSDSFLPTPATTDANGTAASSWTLVAGSNTGTATPAQPLTLTAPGVSFSATAVQLTTLSIATASLPDGQKTIAYGPVTLAATGGAGAGTYSWALAPGSDALPAGLALSGGGVLSGTPTVYGSFTFTVRVTSGPLFTNRAFTVNLLPPPVVITTASPLPSATVGIAYSNTLQAIGGTGTYAWSQTAGALPAGLALSGGGVLSGTPSAPGTANFTVEAASAGLVASKDFSLEVLYPTALTLAFTRPPSGSACYALNKIMAPPVEVTVRTTSGQTLAGVTVYIVAVTNNGSKVEVSQPSATTNAAGVAVFNTLSINKTGAYHLVASTKSPWPDASVQSGKFKISPTC